MADILSKKEIDSLLDSDKFIELLQRTTVRAIVSAVGLLSTKATVELEAEQSISSAITINSPYVRSTIKVFGEVNATIAVILPFELSFILANVTFFDNGTIFEDNIDALSKNLLDKENEKLSLNDVEKLEDTVDDIFRSIGINVKNLSFMIEDTHYVNDGNNHFENLNTIYKFNVGIESFKSTIFFAVDKDFHTAIKDNIIEFSYKSDSEELDLDFLSELDYSDDLDLEDLYIEGLEDTEYLEDTDEDTEEYADLDELFETSNDKEEIDTTESIVLASANGNIEQVKQYINDGVDIDMTDKNGYTALMMATKNRYEKIVKLLLDKGADVDIAREVKSDHEDFTLKYRAIDFVNRYDEAMENILKMLEDMDVKNTYSIVLEELQERNQSSENELSESEIVQLSIREDFDASTTSIYGYKLEGLENLKEKLLILGNKANKHGILSLEFYIDKEKNPLIRRLYAMALDGSRPDTIQEHAYLIQEWLNRVYEHSKDNETKKEYLENLNKEFTLIRKGVLGVQYEDDPEVIFENLDSAITPIDRYDKFYDTEIELDQHSADLVEQEEIVLQEANKYNKTIDQSFHHAIEKQSELILRVIEYATLAIKDGLYILLVASLEENNSFLRNLLQRVGLNQSLGNLSKNINDQIQIVKDKGFNGDFIFDYGRELTSIAVAMYMIQSKSAPRAIELCMLAIYPEKNIRSLFD